MAKKIICKNWDILARSCTTKKIHGANLMIGYRKPRDLRSYLVRAKTDYRPDNDQSKQIPKECADTSNKCTKKDCMYCNLLDRGGKITNENESYSTKTEITCNSSNVIYCLECKKCNKKYVGQTKRKIKDRVREHLYGIKSQKDTDISYHFNTKGHKGKNDVKVYILDFIHAHPESPRAKSLRHTIECNWIHRMGTTAPYGLNILDNRYGRNSPECHVKKTC